MGESAAGDEALVAAARNGVGPDVSLLVDSACVWPDARTALARAKAFEPYDLFLLEEPLHPDDIDGYIWCAFCLYLCIILQVGIEIMHTCETSLEIYPAGLVQVAGSFTSTDRSWRERKWTPRVLAMD